MQLAKRLVPRPVLQLYRNYRTRARVFQLYRNYTVDRQIRRFQPYTIKRQYGDVAIEFLIADPYGKRYYDTDSQELTPELTFIRDRMLKPGDRVLECGTHHGFTTTLFAKWVGEEGSILAFEAARHNYEVLLKNLEMNGVGNVDARNLAVGDSDGVAHISHDMNAEIVQGELGDTVEMVRLDKFKDQPPDMMKIDVEGFEGAVFEGAQELLRHRPKIAIEVHVELMARYNCSVPDLFRLMGLEAYDDVWVSWSPDEAPREYRGEPITHRVHLFAMHKS